MYNWFDRALLMAKRRQVAILLRVRLYEHAQHLVFAVFRYLYANLTAQVRKIRKYIQKFLQYIQCNQAQEQNFFHQNLFLAYKTIID